MQDQASNLKNSNRIVPVFVPAGIFRATIIMTFAFAMFVSINNNAISCPRPPYDYPDQPWEGQGMDSAMLSPTCKVYFWYCWRTVRDANGNPIYYDVNIFQFSPEWGGDCSDVSLEPEHYGNIFDACVAELVTRTPNHWGVTIPLCPEQSEPIWRFFAPYCWTKPYWKWVVDEETGNTVRRLMATACFTLENIGYCYKIYEYCIEVDGTLKPIVIDSGQFTPTLICSPNVITDPVTGEIHECFPTCEE